MHPDGPANPVGGRGRIIQQGEGGPQTLSAPLAPPAPPEIDPSDVANVGDPPVLPYLTPDAVSS